MNIDQNVKQYFDGNPKIDRIFFTSDGQAFKSLQDTNAHTGNLGRAKKDVTVNEVTRDQVNNWYNNTAEGRYTAATAKTAVSLTATNKAYALAVADGTEVGTAQKAMDDAAGTKDEALIEVAKGNLATAKTNAAASQEAFETAKAAYEADVLAAEALKPAAEKEPGAAKENWK